MALGITWILDGLEVTIAGAVAGALQQSPSLRLSATEIGLSASAYLAGAVSGAAFFGYLTDRLGRKLLFNVTLGLYLVAAALTAFSWSFSSYASSGSSPGPALAASTPRSIRRSRSSSPRGCAAGSLVINGSFWIGAALGAAGFLVVLDPDILGADLGWRMAFGIGAVLGLIILYLRRFVPESPRWLLTHGRAGEANRVVADIEARIVAEQGPLPPPDRSIAIRFRSHTPIMVMLRTILVDFASAPCWASR